MTSHCSQQAMNAVSPLLPLAASHAAGQMTDGFLRQPGASTRLAGREAEGNWGSCHPMIALWPSPAAKRRLEGLRLEVGGEGCGVSGGACRVVEGDWWGHRGQTAATLATVTSWPGSREGHQHSDRIEGVGIDPGKRLVFTDFHGGRLSTWTNSRHSGQLAFRPNHGTFPEQGSMLFTPGTDQSRGNLRKPDFAGRSERELFRIEIHDATSGWP